MAEHDLKEELVEPAEKQSVPSRILKGTAHTGKWFLVGLLPPMKTIWKALNLNTLWRLCRAAPGFFRRFLTRNPTAPGAPDLHDFNQVLACWGIDPDEASIQKVISALRMRRFLLCGMSLLFFLSVAVNWEGRTTQMLALGGTAALFVVALITNTWRIQVLSRRQFVFFNQWLRNPFKGWR